MKPKILFVSHEASRTGAPMCLLHFLRWLRANTDQQFEILLGNGGPLESEFAQLAVVHRLHTLASHPGLSSEFALIYSNTCCNGLLLDKLSWPGIPVVTHLHELDYGIDCLGARNVAAVIRQTSHFIACAQSVAERFIHRFRIPERQISIHYEMICPSKVSSSAAAAQPEKLRREYGIPTDALIVAGCGTLDLRKGTDLFVQLAAHVCRQWRRDPPLRFLWIGKNNDPALGRMLTHDVRRLGLQAEIQWIGELESPHALLALSDVFCLTSREDPFPLAMLEAGSLGKPVLCFEGAGGAVEFCALGGGITVPFLDAAAMARHCGDLLVNESLRAEFGNRASELVRSRFSTDAVAPRLWHGIESFVRNPTALPEPRTRHGELAEIYERWLLAECPEPPYVLTHLARKRARAKAHAELQAGRRDAAVKILSNTVTDAIKTEYTPAILETLLEISEDLAPIDPDRSAYLLKQAEILSRGAVSRGEAGQRKLSAGSSARGTTAPRRKRASAHEARNPAQESDGPRTQSSSPTNTTRRQSSTQPPRVSIIIPVFNQLALTQQCLSSLASTTNGLNSEVIVIDNGSTDGTPELFQTLGQAGTIRVVRNPRNEGFARACNQGAQVARGEHLLFLNNDTVATPSWMEAMLEAASRPNVGIVGARLLYADGRIQHAGIRFINGVPDHVHRHAPADAPEVSQFTELDMVTGACLLISRALFLDLGGFDEIYRNGVEDIDLCLRVRACGRKVVYEPKAVVYHLEGQSAGRFDHVQSNLETFFRRWKGAFDPDYRFIVPVSPKIIRSEKTFLTPSCSVIPVDWIGSFLDHGSLSHVNRELTHALTASGEIQLRRVSVEQERGQHGPLELGGNVESSGQRSSHANAAVTVRHAWPPDWRRPQQGRLVVIQPWEFGFLPKQWVKDLAHVDECWVPSKYVKRVYVDSGVPAGKVVVVPNGIDPARFHPQADPMRLATQKKFKFLFVGGTIHRKGPDLLLKAYLESFSAADDVCLVIKDFGGQSFYAGQTFEAKIRAAQALPNGPEILYLNEQMPPESLPGLYTSCDCFVLPYRGEGFGLPVLEAMACGLPVVVTKGGATDDFVPEGFGYHLPSRRRTFGREISGMPLTGDGWMLEADVNALKKWLRHVFENREEARELGKRASTYARENWIWEKSAQIAARQIRQLASQLPSVSVPEPNGKPARIQLPAAALVGHLGAARELWREKKLAPAWSVVLEAIALRPFHPEAFLMLAELAWSAGQQSLMRQCLDRATALAPHWKAIKKFAKAHPPRKPAGKADLPPIPQAGEPRLSVCLIVRNEEQFLENCLKSIQPIASQIIVVDTGSTDRTVEIAKEFGAEIYFHGWNDDFSAARNVGLEHATGDWILILDADEELLGDSRETLQKEMRAKGVMAYRLPMIDKGKEAEGRSYVPRLFRNVPGLFYVGRVHEQVFSSIEVRRREWGLEGELGKSVLFHHGYTPEILRSRDKVARNLRLLERAVEELPGEPNLLMNLGLELVRSDRINEGLVRYEEALESMTRLSPDSVVPELRESLLTQYSTHLLRAKRFHEVARVLQAPLAARGGLTASLHFTLGLAFLELKNYRNCAEQMRQCVAKRQRPALCPVNKDIFKAGPHHCLALCCASMRETDEAAKAFELALKDDPDSAAARFDFARFLSDQNRPVEALNHLHEVITRDPALAGAWALGAEIALGSPDFLEFGRDWTGEAVRHFPADTTLLRKRAEVLLLSKEIAAAREIFIALKPQEPADAAAAALCELALGSSPGVWSGSQEKRVSHEFLNWYRRLLQFGCKETITAINARVDALKTVLPTVGRILEAAVTEAENELATGN
jgi:GT2 family glycosyltransferase/tetratricopeptide (TPR) repeat protein